jgi:L-seryl-tRNA(Ser) seleniumtransferase
MMMPGDAPVVAQKVHQVLANPKPVPAVEKPQVSGNALSGEWDVEIRFVRGEASHRLFLEQKGGDLLGHHRGDILSGDARGTFDGSRVKLRSSHRYEGTSLSYNFDGVLEGNTITGKVEMGEYGSARFTAKRHFAG